MRLSNPMIGAWLVAAGLTLAPSLKAEPLCPVVGDVAVLNSNGVVDVGGDFRPQTATDGAGNWVTVWSSSDALGGTIGTDRDILVSRSTDNGETWTAVAVLNSNAATDGGNDLAVQLATDREGTWVAVWYSTDTLGGTLGSDADLLFARSTDNGATWTAVAALNTNAGVDLGFDGFPEIATDGLGNWVVVWDSEEDLNGMINDDDRDILFAVSSNDAVSWSGPGVLNSTACSDAAGATDFGAQVATDGSGRWIAAWASTHPLGGSGADADILYATSTTAALFSAVGGCPDSNWSAAALLNSNATTDSGEDFSPQVTTDGAGLWIAAWESTDPLGATVGVDFDIFYSRSLNNGGSWSSVSVLNNSAFVDVGDDRSPQLTSDGLGEWVAVWNSTENLDITPIFDADTDLDIVFARSSDGGLSWTPMVSNCCTDNQGLGCDDAVCEDAVCSDTPFCCSTAWNIFCAGQLAFTLCDICDPQGQGLICLNNTAYFDAGDDSAPQLVTDGNGRWLAVWGSTEKFVMVENRGRACVEDFECDELANEECHSKFCQLSYDSDSDIFVTFFGLDHEDCNANGNPDRCDVAGGLSADCNENEVPDECESLASDIDDQPDSTAACVGAEAGFTVVASGGTGTITYQWRKNGTPIGGATSSSLMISPVAPGDAGTYDVVVTNDCGSVISDPALLTVNANPTPTVGASPAADVCSGATVTLAAGSYSAYLWSPGGQTTPTIDVTSAGTYGVTVTDANGCTGLDDISVSFTPCPGDLLCDPTDGQCKECLVGADCVDGDPCTNDTCTAGTCSNPASAVGTPCEDDADLCTLEQCNGAGACMPFDTVSCQAARPPCEGGALCNPATGDCDNQADAPLGTTCDADADACTLDHCNGNGACVMFDEVPCDSGSTCMDGVCVPDNDACGGALAIGLGITAGTTDGASTDSGTPSPCGAFITSPGVWYSVSGTGNTMTASTCGPVFEFNTKLSIYRGTCAGLLCVAGNDDNCPGGASSTLSSADWCSDPGVTYYILVHGLSGQTGDFELEIADGAGCVTCMDDMDCSVGEYCMDGTCIPAPTCGEVGSGDCLDLGGTGSPGCEDFDCCFMICTNPLFAFCCDVEWDDTCASEAVLECKNPANCTPTDLNMDGMTDAADLAQLLGSWGSNPGHPADFNGDGVINAADLAQLLGSWGAGESCPPGQVCVRGTCVPE